MKTDTAGRRIDCHFLVQSKKRTSCSALVDFYNANEPSALCDGCPFFKTDEEFNKGWNRRLLDDNRYLFTEAI